MEEPVREHAQTCPTSTASNPKRPPQGKASRSQLPVSLLCLSDKPEKKSGTEPSEKTETQSDTIKPKISPKTSSKTTSRETASLSSLKRDPRKIWSEDLTKTSPISPKERQISGAKSQSDSLEFTVNQANDLQECSDFLWQELTTSSRWAYLIPDEKERAKVLSVVIHENLKWLTQDGNGNVWEYREKGTNALLAVTAWLPSPKLFTPPALFDASLLSTDIINHITTYYKKLENWMEENIAQLEGQWLYNFAISSSVYSTHNIDQASKLYEAMVHPEKDLTRVRPVIIEADQANSHIFESLGFITAHTETPTFQPDPHTPWTKLMVKLPAAESKAGKAITEETNNTSSPKKKTFTLPFDTQPLAPNLSPVLFFSLSQSTGNFRLLPKTKKTSFLMTRANGNKLSTLAIIPASNPWDKSSYYMLAQPEIYTTEVAGLPHFGWIVKHKTTNFPGQHNFSLVFAYQKGSSLNWVHLTSKGYQDWSVEMPSDKKFHWHDKGGICPDTCKKYIKHKISDLEGLRELKITSDIKSQICSIDLLKTVNLKTLELGILYVPRGAKTIQNIISNKTKPSENFGSFLKAINVPEGPGDEGLRVSVWQGLTVNWLIGTEMKKDDRRRRIGNAMCLVLFYDSMEPWDISMLFLGQVTNFICVLQQAGPQYPDMWKAGFFVHYEQKFSVEVPRDPQILAQETYVSTTLCDFPPQIPKDFLFHQSTLTEFILTKCFNARLQASSMHNAVRLQFELPVGTRLEAFVKDNEPEFFAKFENK